MQKLKYDHVIEKGEFGNSIQWWDTDKPFVFEADERFKIVGWKSPMVKIGEKIIGEFEKLWATFEIVEVNRYNDPADMFMGIVKPLKVYIKETREYIEVK